MELTPKQQATEFIKKSNKILLLTHKIPGGDAIGSLLGLKRVLEKMGKQISCSCPEIIPTNLHFLPDWQSVTQQFSGSREMIISLDMQDTSVDRLSYRTEGSKLNIILTPARGQLDPANFKFIQGEYKFDLIIVLDCPDLDRLGALFENNSEIFYEKPVINIDHHSSNDYFGKVNLVDITATSTCEILLSLTEALGGEKNLLDEDIATAYLCGIIADTGSFQNSNTTPKSFTVAAQLVAAGSRQQQIIKNLYKTRSLSQLRLWGRVLAQAREDKPLHLVWSYVLARDLEQTQTKESEVPGVLDELLASTPDAEIILLLVEGEGKVTCHLRTVKGIDRSKIGELFKVVGNSHLEQFTLESKSLAEAEKEILDKIRGFQSKRLGITLGQTLVSQLPQNAKGSSPIEVSPKEEQNKFTKPNAIILSQKEKK